MGRNGVVLLVFFLFALWQAGGLSLHAREEKQMGKVRGCGGGEGVGRMFLLRKLFGKSVAGIR